MQMKRKGKLAKNEEGSLILINEENKGYRVDEVVAAIWSRCDGKSVDGLTREIAEETKLSEEELKPQIERIVGKLKEAKLIE